MARFQWTGSCLVFETPQSAGDNRLLQGESPLNMMRPPRQRPARRPSAAPARRSWIWAVVVPVGVVIALSAGWCWLWYYSASVADRTLSGWVEREAAAGRVYSCGTQDIAGFPFRIQAHCVEAAPRSTAISRRLPSTPKTSPSRHRCFIRRCWWPM